MMKPLGLSVVVISVLALSACSKGPSESDAKKIVQNAIGDCRYISIDSFNKVNGIPDGAGRYRVDVAYSIKMEPTEETKKILDENLPAISKATIDSKLEDVEIKQYMSEESAYKEANPWAVEDTFRTRYPEKYKQYEAIYELHNKNEGIALYGSRRVKELISEKVYAACPNTSRSLLFSLFTGDTPLDAYKENIVQKYTHTFQMIKTDNGWLENR